MTIKINECYSSLEQEFLKGVNGGGVMQNRLGEQWLSWDRGVCFFRYETLIN